MNNNPRFYTLVAILVAAIIALSVASGGFPNVGRYACKHDAESLNLTWKYDYGVCMVQNKQGGWKPIQDYRVPQVP